MAFVVAERTMPAPQTPAQVGDSIRGGKWCNDLYGITHCGSLLAPDRRRMVCFYRAPDAESVRCTSQRLTVPYDHICSATLHGPVESDPKPAVPAEQASADLPPDRSTVLVQRGFEAPVTFDDLQAREAAHGWCLSQHQVRFLQSFLSLDRRRMLCLYAAPDAEAVRRVQHQAGLPVEQLWSAAVCRP
jgi:hypothetical protein